jgi:hypothetical protein
MSSDTEQNAAESTPSGDSREVQVVVAAMAEPPSGEVRVGPGEVDR